jgi:hypothetical protein
MLAKDKHSSLLRNVIIYVLKKVYKIDTWANVINIFTAVSYDSLL